MNQPPGSSFQRPQAPDQHAQFVARPFANGTAAGPGGPLPVHPTMNHNTVMANGVPPGLPQPTPQQYGKQPVWPSQQQFPTSTTVQPNAMPSQPPVTSGQVPNMNNAPSYPGSYPNTGFTSVPPRPNASFVQSVPQQNSYPQAPAMRLPAQTYPGPPQPGPMVPQGQPTPNMTSMSAAMAGMPPPSYQTGPRPTMPAPVVPGSQGFNAQMPAPVPRPPASFPTLGQPSGMPTQPNVPQVPPSAAPAPLAQPGFGPPPPVAAHLIPQIPPSAVSPPAFAPPAMNTAPPQYTQALPQTGFPQSPPTAALNQGPGPAYPGPRLPPMPPRPPFPGVPGQQAPVQNGLDQSGSFDRSNLQSPLQYQGAMPSAQPPMPPMPPMMQMQNTQNFQQRQSLPPAVHHAPPIGQFANMNMGQHQGPLNLLQDRNVLPDAIPPPPSIDLPNLFAYHDVNAHPDVFRCTMNAIPASTELLKRARLPLGLILHPFKDLKQLNVLQASVIVRCRQCRTYINPFVQFPDQRHWKCNICFRSNDLPKNLTYYEHFLVNECRKVGGAGKASGGVPDEFHFDPATKSYGDPQRRPEIKNATVEFIAPSEYMLRPPQPAVYLFVFDVSQHALETGYLPVTCSRILENLANMPGDKRTEIGFITVDTAIHFYLFPEEPMGTPTQLSVTDVDDIFLPHTEDRLLVNVDEYKEGIEEFLKNLPNLFHASRDHGQSKSALGAALKAAYLLMYNQGGRVSVFQTVLSSLGPGALENREDPNERASKDVKNLNPSTDFYKTLALECAGQQIAMDLFLLSDSYADLATIGCISKFSGGCVHYFPGFHTLKNPIELARFEDILDRYLTRKHGFEAVLRIRCTRGLSLHTFHGNAFVRSIDLLALPNVNPDSAFGVQLQMEENLTESKTVSFQAALLFTSSRGERRIRVHTLCIPITSNLSDVFLKMDATAICGLLARMAVERSCNGTLSDAREALVNSAVDAVGAFGSTLTSGQRMGVLVVPETMRLLPLFVLGLLKHPAFAFGTSIRLDERVSHMYDFKSMPLLYTLLQMHPHMYALHTLDEESVEKPKLVALSYERMDRHGAYIMDTGTHLNLFLGQALPDAFLKDVFGAPALSHVDDDQIQFPELDTPMSKLVRKLVDQLEHRRPFSMPLRIYKEGSPRAILFMRRLIEDRSESTFSYPEFLQYLQKELRSH